MAESLCTIAAEDHTEATVCTGSSKLDNRRRMLPGLMSLDLFLENKSVLKFSGGNIILSF